MLLAFIQPGILLCFLLHCVNIENRLQNQKLETVRAENLSCEESSPSVYDPKTCKVTEKVKVKDT